MAKGSNGGGTTVAQRPARRDFLDLLDASKGEIAKLLPDERTTARAMRIARSAYQMDAKLQGCSPGSILASVMKAAELGLEPGGALGHAYLIPYSGVCTFQVGYKGLLALAHRSGAFKAIEARLVFERDVFQIAYDPTPVFRHVPYLSGDPGAITHAYGYAKLKSGEVVFEVMTKAEIDKVRSRHAAANSPAWRDYYGEQAKKTVLKRFLKRQPCSVEMADAIDHDNAEYTVDVIPGRRPGRALGNAGVLAALGAPDEEPAFAEGTSGQITTEADEQAFEDAIERGEV